jgi:hypothetical protein
MAIALSSSQIVSNMCSDWAKHLTAGDQLANAGNSLLSHFLSNVLSVP